VRTGSGSFGVVRVEGPSRQRSSGGGGGAKKGPSTKKNGAGGGGAKGGGAKGGKGGGANGKGAALGVSSDELRLFDDAVGDLCASDLSSLLCDIGQVTSTPAELAAQAVEPLPDDDLVRAHVSVSDVDFGGTFAGAGFDELEFEL
jgi:hypothetical protein